MVTVEDLANIIAGVVDILAPAMHKIFLKSLFVNVFILPRLV